MNPSLANSGDYYLALIRGESRGLGPGLLRCGLYLASVPYGWGVRLRNRLYDQGWLPRTRVPVPVVGIGNLTLGGTGKTPCVEYVARFYQEQHRRVAILSRGYGSIRGRNDESLLLEENVPGVPHLQGSDRVALAVAAVEQHQSEVLVLDDGFQHRRLARDLDVVLIDATQPWGQGYLFPRGLLREPAEGLRRAGMVLLTRCDQAASAARTKLRDEIARLSPGVPVAETRHRPLHWVNLAHETMPVEAMKGRPAAAFCGIGNPAAFQRTLADLGVETCAFRTFPDHHAYSPTDLENLSAWARQQAKECVLVTTQKDLVKILLVQKSLRSEALATPSPPAPLPQGERGADPVEAWALRIGLHFESGQEEFHKVLSFEF